MPGGTHEYIQDPRNDNVLIYINGEMLPRPEAKVSVFDSGFLLGSACTMANWYFVRNILIAYISVLQLLEWILACPKMIWLRKSMKHWQ